MLIINDKFKIDSDKYQFILIETYEGKDRDGYPKQHERMTYYPCLEQCLKAIRDEECKEAGTVAELLEALHKAYELDSRAVIARGEALTTI